MRAMAAGGSFHGPRRGESEILGESRTKDGVSPYLASATERRYNLTARQVDVSGFDAMLGSIDEDWREHLSRTP
jgi:hypothetical protein